MKVAMVTPYWYPIRGGVTTYVAGLSAELRAAFSADVRVLAREGGAPGAVAVGGRPQEFHRRVAPELKGFAPEAVHAHGHWYTLQAAVSYRFRHPRTRVVFTIHTEFPRRSVMRDRALGRLLSKADVLTALSRDLLDRTLQAYDVRATAEVVAPGVSMAPASRNRVQAFLRGTGLAGRGPVIAFLGPLAWEAKSRGVVQLIEALKLVRKRHPAAVLAVAGEGPYRPELQALAEREIPGGAVFLGTVEDASLFLSSADVYAHVSFQEGFGLAVLEAMACGIPVVATRVGGIPSVIRSGENGLLTSGEPRDLADVILSVLDAPDRTRRIAAQGLRDVAERYSWRAAAERFLALYSGTRGKAAA